MIQHIELKRENKATRINEILNHPAVRPWIADTKEGIIDLQFRLDNPLNILLVGEFGAVMFLYLMKGVYEVHTQVLPEGRGKWTISLLHSAFYWMFTRTNCYELLTRVPKSHPLALAATKKVGAKYEFTREDGCIFNDKVVPVDIYSMRIQDWCLICPYLIEAGQWFHEKLEAEAKRIGIKEAPHLNDENHNRFVGAAYSIMKGGQLAKAVNIYNRWAIVSRHAVIAIASTEPPAIKIDIGYLKMNNGDIELSL